MGSDVRTSEGQGGFDFSEILNDLFRQSRSHPQRADGADIQAEIEVDLRDAALGAERDISVDSPAACATCHGDGVKPGSKPGKCPNCKGSGRERMPGLPIPIVFSVRRDRTEGRTTLPHLSWFGRSRTTRAVARDDPTGCR